MTSLLSKPKAPKATKPLPDPDEQGPLYQEMRRKQLQEASSRSGRASTVLTSPPTVLGDYTRGVLG